MTNFKAFKRFSKFIEMQIRLGSNRRRKQNQHDQS